MIKASFNIRKLVFGLLFSALLFLIQVGFFYSIGNLGLDNYNISFALFVFLVFVSLRAVKQVFNKVQAILISIPFIIIYFYILYVVLCLKPHFGLKLVSSYYFLTVVFIFLIDFFISSLKSQPKKFYSTLAVAVLIPLLLFLLVDFKKKFYDKYSWAEITHEEYMHCDFSYVNSDSDTISLRNNILDPQKIYLVDIWSVSCLPCREYHENVIVPALSQFKDTPQLEFWSVHAPCKDESCVQRYIEFVKKYNAIYKGSILPFEVTNWGDQSGILGNYIIVDNQIKYFNNINSGLYEDDISRLTKVLKSCLEINN
jgi:hypothetical protein